MQAYIDDSYKLTKFIACIINTSLFQANERHIITLLIFLVFTSSECTYYED